MVPTWSPPGPDLADYARAAEAVAEHERDEIQSEAARHDEVLGQHGVQPQASAMEQSWEQLLGGFGDMSGSGALAFFPQFGGADHNESDGAARSVLPVVGLGHNEKHSGAPAMLTGECQ